MKRILHNILCLLLIASPIQAQDEQTAGIPDQKEEQHLTYEQMTDIMNSELHLDEKQQAKLLKINRRFKTLIEGDQRQPPMMGGMGEGSFEDSNGDNHMGSHRTGGRMGGMAGGPMGGGPGGGMGGGRMGSMGGGPMGGGPGGGMAGGRMGSMGGGPMGGGMSGGPMGGGPGGPEAYDYERQQRKYDKAVRKLLTDDQYESYLQIKPQFYSQRRIRDYLLGE